MFYGDLSYELAKERMESSLRTAEHDRLVKQLRSARKGLRSDGVVARSAALVTSLFR